MRVERLSDDVVLYCGDSLEVMAELEANSVDSVITDPPYGLQFMGKEWDRGVPGIPFWEQALRVSKPGAMLLSFGGTRTYHRLVSAIENAGWEIRDMVSWIYGQGFPKSLDISKAIDKAAGAEREVVGVSDKQAAGFIRHGRTDEQVFMGTDGSRKAETLTAPATTEAQLWDGWGTALKPSVEPICLAMKSIEGTYAENALKWGVAGLNIDGGRVGTEEHTNSGMSSLGVMHDDNWKPKEVLSTVTGRWPANLIHDGSDEVVSLFPNSNGGAFPIKSNVPTGKHYEGGWGNVNNGKRTEMGGGSAARFFYCAKASRAERNAGLDGMEEKAAFDNSDGSMGGNMGSLSKPRQNYHPTVKPVALMEYLAKLTKTPTGGVVLDPFMGSGTTGIGCVKLGRPFIGIELDEDYFEIAKRRILHAMKQMRLEI